MNLPVEIIKRIMEYYPVLRYVKGIWRNCIAPERYLAISGENIAKKSRFLSTSVLVNFYHKNENKIKYVFVMYIRPDKLEYYFYRWDEIHKRLKDEQRFEVS